MQSVVLAPPPRVLCRRREGELDVDVDPQAKPVFEEIRLTEVARSLLPPAALAGAGAPGAPGVPAVAGASMAEAAPTAETATPETESAEG